MIHYQLTDPSYFLYCRNESIRDEKVTQNRDEVTCPDCLARFAELNRHMAWLKSHGGAGQKITVTIRDLFELVREASRTKLGDGWQVEESLIEPLILEGKQNTSLQNQTGKDIQNSPRS